MVPMRTLKNGVNMPMLGFGTWTLQGQSCTELVAYALQHGYSAIDTAQAYQNEEAVGEGIRCSGRNRKDIFLTSKLRNRFQGYDTTLKAVEASLQRTGSDYIDLFLIHWPGESAYIPTWKALVRLYKEGMLRSIGVSNFCPEHLERCAQESGIMPMVNQIEMHPYLQQYDTVDYCQKNDIFLVSWSPLSAAGANRQDTKTRGMSCANVMEDPVIVSIAKIHDKTPGQIVLRWHIQNGFGIIPKSSNYGHIIENTKLFNFKLTASEMKQIQELTKKQIRIGDDPKTYRFLLLKDLLASGKNMEKDQFGNIL
ncbi:MAG: aldo/keto reductase [Lachnospiraceae bacterium]|nr:aldo/keto reductase [Lachnospiraceae bacterium]